MKYIIYFIFSFILGTLYYYNMSLSIPKDSNCSFSANIWTDIGAFIGGGVLVYRGIHKYDDPTITVIGFTIIVEHLWQLVHNKLPFF